MGIPEFTSEREKKKYFAKLSHGKYLIIINKGKTKMEGSADLVFHDSISKILGYL